MSPGSAAACSTRSSASRRERRKPPGHPQSPRIVSEGHGATYNDPALTRRVVASLVRTFGAERVVETPPVMVGEDFGEFGKAAGAPSLLLWIGATAPARLAEAGGDADRVPFLHSALFAPDREPTLKTGVAALTVAAMELLAKP